MTPRDDFYIGYEGAMPAGIRAAVRRVVVATLLISLTGAVVVTLSQRPLPNARFEFGQPRHVEGWLTMSPAPSLLVPDGTDWAHYWLVARGKFGAERELQGRSQGWIVLEATLVSREGWQMLEVVPGSMRASNRSSPPPPPHQQVVSKPFTARGEIVDSKCYLGVMNPGSDTAHRDCAVRCLSGGIPSMFAYRDVAGRSHLALLLLANGERPGRRWQRLAGAPVSLSGQLSQHGDLEVLVLDGP